MRTLNLEKKLGKTGMVNGMVFYFEADISEICDMKKKKKINNFYQRTYRVALFQPDC